MTDQVATCTHCADRVGDPILTGRSANPGCVTGEVVVMMDPKLSADMPDGAILITPMTDPNAVPAMERAAAVVTDRGGLLCHAAIVSREMGKPCVVGSKMATEILSDGDVVRVCATSGVIYPTTDSADTNNLRRIK